MKLTNIDMNMLQAVTDLKQVPDGAVNIRLNGEAVVRSSSPNIEIRSRTDGRPGFEVEVKAGTRGEKVHVPVLVTGDAYKEKVYNTFIVNENAEVEIVAGCGIHNSCGADSQHDGVHTIFVKENARMRYVEKHYGEGSGSGKRVLNPYTEVIMEKGASAEMEMVQIEGVDDTLRTTVAHVGEKANLKIIERLLTQGEQEAESDIQIYIEGQDGNAQILSRSVAQEKSRQVFRAALIGKTACSGHVECDSIIMGQARIQSIPQLDAEDAEAVLTHEAAIGKIAGEQLIKLMSMGLTEQEAIDLIIEGFLR